MLIIEVRFVLLMTVFISITNPSIIHWFRRSPAAFACTQIFSRAHTHNHQVAQLKDADERSSFLDMYGLKVGTACAACITLHTLRFTQYTSHSQQHAPRITHHASLTEHHSDNWSRENRHLLLCPPVSCHVLYRRPSGFPFFPPFLFHQFVFAFGHSSSIEAMMVISLACRRHAHGRSSCRLKPPLQPV